MQRKQIINEYTSPAGFKPDCVDVRGRWVGEVWSELESCRASENRRQAIIWNNAGILLIQIFETNVSEL